MTMITEPFLYAARAYRDGIETGGYERFGDLASLKGGATPVVLGVTTCAASDAAAAGGSGGITLRTVAYISRYLHDHALMIASYFRTNARLVRQGMAPYVNIVTYARMCQTDIANGANPPPPMARQDSEPYFDAEE